MISLSPSPTLKDMDSNLFDTLVPFLKENAEQLRLWVKEHHQKCPHMNDWEILKSFIRHLNLPFDMNCYMQEQRNYIQEHISECPSCEDAQKRQKFVQEWINNFAKEHRKNWIENQCCCIDDHKEDIRNNLSIELETIGLHL